jgi:SAM-dependent methyltransferase
MVSTPTGGAQAPPTPERIFFAINAHQQSAALKAAIEVGLFTAIAEGKSTAAEIASRCGASERGVRILSDYLTVHGFLTKTEGRYGLAPDAAAFLNQHSPAYMGSAVDFLLSPLLLDGFKDLGAVVRTGTTTLPGEGTVTPENPVWVQFARAMMPMMAMPAQQLANLVPLPAGGGQRKVLDIAAGHGLFGIAFAEKHPNAHVTALDWPAVLEVAKENAARRGMADRYALLPGDAFQVPFGAGYDLVLLTNFLHHFDPPTCTTLLRKVYDALAPGGKAVALEFVPNEDRVTPPGSATFSLMMLSNTPAGDAYTFSELRSMFEGAGFIAVEKHDLPLSIQQVVIGTKG